MIDDEYVVTLPGTVVRGEYPLEIGLYDAKSGERLRLASGDSRLLLNARLHVAP